MSTPYRLIFFVPTSAVSACKAAILACCWTTPGTAQFCPGDAAKPHIGKVGELEVTEEIRVEALCASEDIARKAVKALKKAHPYEQPSHGVYKMKDF
ncbi:hypothetical protein BDV29DRAFT_187437 [Aspergillus leporis]|uniref:ATP phosphoribosyltransferase n=1 Tax=Aspergillus leporis TaxID=41062 RepID=A0A5N5XEU4_9EURO|nr:hypothetical protein BDV29DRAFT_187437 [Aspergillus leporis]